MYIQCETVIKGLVLVEVLEYNVTLHAAQMNLITSLLILSTGKITVNGQNVHLALYPNKQLSSALGHFRKPHQTSHFVCGLYSVIKGQLNTLPNVLEFCKVPLTLIRNRKSIFILSIFRKRLFPKFKSVL